MRGAPAAGPPTSIATTGDDTTLPLPPITIYTPPLAALGGLEGGGRVEEKLLIHDTGRSPMGSLYR